MSFRIPVKSLSILAATALTTCLLPGCASSDESSAFTPTKDASSDGVAGSGGAGASGGSGGTGGSSAAGGTGGVGATGGSSGAGATAGSGGFGATGGGSSDGGTCQPVFCPSVGTGTPCCVTPNGPCGVDYGFGNGCEVPTGPDV